jgi:hypothetical protein
MQRTKKLIQKRLHSGAFRSVEEAIHAETEWLAENKEAIDEKIARG